MLASGCSGDDAGARSDAQTAKDAAIDAADDSAALADAATETSSGPQGIWTQWTLPAAVNANLYSVWSDHPTRIVAVGTGGSIVRWDGLGWQVSSNGQLPTLFGVSAAPGATTAFAVGQAGTAVLARGKDGAPGSQWAPSDGCKGPADCDDADACSLDVCESGLCRHEPSAAPGCCGGVAFADNFDKGLGNWTATDAKAAPNGGIVWTSASLYRPDGSLLANTPPRAAVFARTDVPCPGEPGKWCATFDNGKAVGSVLTSAKFAIPQAASAKLGFALSMQVGAGFADRFRVSVVTASGSKSLLWDKEDDLPLASTGGKFVSVSLDLSTWVGQTIALEFSFDSLTAQDNGGTGVAIDDVQVTSACAPKAGGKPLTSQPIFAVHAFSDNDAWAVGGKGFSAHWDGQTWQQVSGGPPAEALTALSCASADADPSLPAGVAVGGASTFKLGTGWLPAAPPPVGSWQSVRVASVAGGPLALAGTTTGGVWRWEAGSWLPEDSSISGPVLGLGQLGDGTWLAMGSDEITERKQDGSWTLVHAGGPWLGVGAAGSLAIAVGNGGALAERKGGVWQNLTLPVADAATEHARAVHVFANGAAIAVGDGGVSFVRSPTGSWTRVMTSTSVNLYGVWGASADDVWAAGLSSNLVRWNGQSWKNVKGPGGAGWYALGGRSSSEVYAAGDQGRIARWDGAMWLLEAGGPVEATLRAVWGASPTELWAVGDKASVYRSKGGPWQKMPVEPYEAEGEEPIKPDGTLLAIWGASPDDVWAMGEPTSKGLGQVLHWDGQVWRLVPLRFGDPRVVRAVWGWDAKRMLVAGTSGLVARFDGQQFVPLDPGTVATLYAIAPFGKDALLVGDGATLLRYTPAW